MNIPVKINCNLDDYTSSDFPTTFVVVPRAGEMIQVKHQLLEYLNKLKLPIELEVKKVYHKDGHDGPYIMVDVWYSENSYKAYFPDGLQNRR